MSGSSHPIAARLERAVDGPTRLLATVMLLPLVDGIFPALVLAGAVDSVAGILQVGLLVFGGSATLAIVLAELDGTRREQVRIVLAVGALLIPLAAVQAALAPTIAAVMDLDVFARFAALVVAAVAAKTASARVGELLPRPAVIVGLGVVASVRPAGAELVVHLDPTAVVHGTAAGAVGVGFALAVALAAPRLREAVLLDRFRFGSAVALGLLALSVVGFPFGRAPLAVLAVTAVFAYDPAAAGSRSDGDGTAGHPAPDGRSAGEGSSPGVQAVTDGGDRAAVDGERPPWF